MRVKNFDRKVMGFSDLLTVMLVAVCLPILIPWALTGHIILFLTERARRKHEYPRGHGRAVAYMVAWSLGPTLPLLAGAAAMKSIVRSSRLNTIRLRERVNLARARGKFRKALKNAEKKRIRQHEMEGDYCDVTTALQELSEISRSDARGGCERRGGTIFRSLWVLDDYCATLGGKEQVSLAWALDVIRNKVDA